MTKMIQFTFSGRIQQLDAHSVTMEIGLVGSDPIIDQSVFDKLACELSAAEANALRDELETYCFIQCVKRSIQTCIIAGRTPTQVVE